MVSSQRFKIKRGSTRGPEKHPAMIIRALVMDKQLWSLSWTNKNSLLIVKK
jgi:hypothetical protein